MASEDRLLCSAASRYGHLPPNVQRRVLGRKPLAQIPANPTFAHIPSGNGFVLLCHADNYSASRLQAIRSKVADLELDAVELRDVGPHRELFPATCKSKRSTPGVLLLPIRGNMCRDTRVHLPQSTVCRRRLCPESSLEKQKQSHLSRAPGRRDRRD